MKYKLREKTYEKRTFVTLKLSLFTFWIVLCTFFSLNIEQVNAENCNPGFYAFQTGPGDNMEYVDVTEITYELTSFSDDFEFYPFPDYTFQGVNLKTMDANRDGVSDQDFVSLSPTKIIWRPANGIRRITQQGCIDNATNYNCAYVIAAWKRKPSLQNGNFSLVATAKGLLSNGEDYTFTRTYSRTFSDCQINTSTSEMVEEPSHVDEKRIALVIGNGDYKDSPLRNPVNDAHDITTILHQLGFTVITKTNINQRDMEQAIHEFSEEIRDGDVALFYFSGHGSQVKGENYLIPIGEYIQSESDIRYKAVNAGYILGKMEESGNRTNILILDACRNNPFKGFRSLSKGLTIMEAPGGTFIAYATAPNTVAFDGTDRNGIYTKYLLEAMKIKGISIEQTLKNVLREVEKETNGQQIPWTASSLRNNFYFNP